MNKWGLGEKRGFVEQYLYKYGKIISPRSNGWKTVSCLSSLPMIKKIYLFEVQFERKCCLAGP